MEDYYATLPNHRTPGFPNNTPVLFMVRLAHLLDFPPDG